MVFSDGQSNSVIFPDCHGNEIWDRMGYNSASARDICKIFESVGEFLGLGHRMLPTKLAANRNCHKLSRIL